MGEMDEIPLKSYMHFVVLDNLPRPFSFSPWTPPHTSSNPLPVSLYAFESIHPTLLGSFESFHISFLYSFLWIP
ncbi:hypothetical protein RchiOBHm_Chr3g0448101 [Rosa chinensis]|uniref:Uncharacterized protein n=1 Tax=Rosa chinensis TaxID=74649 RepID=A0A2P6R541_ROSCH|nr:hypothetical protein RchiOBHm_Chr3g0448101 [Rosa chinensis]